MVRYQKVPNFYFQPPIIRIDFCWLKIQFIELDFSKLIFQKSSTDQQGEYLLEWGSNPRKYYIFRAEIEKYFVQFLVQMKTAKSPFEIN